METLTSKAITLKLKPSDATENVKAKTMRASHLTSSVCFGGQTAGGWLHSLRLQYPGRDPALGAWPGGGITQPSLCQLAQKYNCSECCAPTRRVAKPTICTPRKRSIKPLHQLFLSLQGGLLPKPHGPGASIKFHLH